MKDLFEIGDKLRNKGFHATTIYTVTEHHEKDHVYIEWRTGFKVYSKELVNQLLVKGDWINITRRKK